jgi:hypothetical protein
VQVPFVLIFSLWLNELAYACLIITDVIILFLQTTDVIVHHYLVSVMINDFTRCAKGEDAGMPRG